MNVYVITNTVNGRCYIGKAKHPERRWQQHRANANEGRVSALYHALRKYGAESFEFSVVERCESDAAAFDAEVVWITKLRSTGVKLYNQTAGGDGLCDPSPEVRARMSAAATGRPWHGVPHSEEARERMSKAKAGMTWAPEHVAKRAAGVRANGKKAAVMDRIRELHAQGLNNAQIAQAVGRTNSTVWQLLREMGLKSNAKTGGQPGNKNRLGGVVPSREHVR